MKKITGLIFTMVIVTCCKCQNIQYGNKLKHKVKARIDSLYPHATGRVIFNDKYVSDTTQEIQINCHCEETDGMIILVFDTTGNLLNKDVHYGSIKNLPDTILEYMKKNASSSVKFFNDMTKSINSKGEISYSIVDIETHPYTLNEYILKFKPSGELISKENVPGGEQ